ncbi:MAG: hypothetical protein NC200_04860 [Candidatus Gastranaerophilales bacterium]|nr:hypothetical protein [Candidatus Gastranaerophilales bacterium]
MINSIPTRIIPTRPQLKLVPSATLEVNGIFESMIENSNSSIKRNYLTYLVKPLMKFAFKHANIIQNSKTLLDSKNEEIGNLVLSYKKKNKKTMHVEFLNLNEKERRSPNTFIESAFVFIKEILKQGNKKSIDKITCKPSTPTQKKLYTKFGFKENENNILEVPFNEFKENAQMFINKYSQSR